MQKRQVRLIEEITSLWNPRLGTDRTIAAVMERLQDFYDADVCLMVAAGDHSGKCMLHKVDRSGPSKAVEVTGTKIKERLLSLPEMHSVVFSRGESLWSELSRHQEAVEIRDVRRQPGTPELGDTVADVLEVESFVGVPLVQYGRTIGRLYLGAKKANHFSSIDAYFLYEVMERALPVIENIRLLDRLASDAAEQERQRIARDIHDTVIQPYIGIQMGLASIREKLGSGADGLVEDIDHLIALTDIQISGLRRHVKGFDGPHEADHEWLDAVQRFADKFSAATGISVELRAAEVMLTDRLGAEVFQMIAEGLSNIRRHTTATEATIEMKVSNDHFTLRILNQGADENLECFFPRSIGARTAALGGRTKVELAGDGTSAVVVEIPL